MATKTIVYVNSATKRAVRDLPNDVAIDFLNDLGFVAAGKNPRSDFKSLSSIGPGVIELIENGSPAFRLMYCAKYLDTVYILHAFTKTTNGVDRAAMATVEKRYKEMMAIVSKGRDSGQEGAKALGSQPNRPYATSFSTSQITVWSPVIDGRSR